MTLFPLGTPIIGEAAQKAFIKLFGSILRLKNILVAFDDFVGNEILSDRDFQDYQSLYLNLYAEFRSVSEAEKETINDDVVFEIELIKQVEINVDYILMLVERYIQAKGTGKDKEILATIERAVNSSPSLRNKKDLIEQFVDSVSTTAKVDAGGSPSSLGRRLRSLTRSSPTKTSMPMRRRRSWKMPSVMARFRRQVRRSRRSCRRCRASRKTTAIRRRSRPCWISSPRSSSAISGWRRREDERTRSRPSDP